MPDSSAVRTTVRDAVERSAAPAAVAVALAQLADARPDLDARLESDPPLLEALVAVVAASRSLTRLLIADPLTLPVLGALDQRLPPPGDHPTDLAGWKQRELVRIAARDLTGLDALEAVGANLARLGDDVLSVATAAAAPAGGLGVIGMGKLGGRELNYASDIDVLFVGDGDARPVMELARSCFRVDANLRPEGRDGPLVRSLASYENYWDRWAQAWEFQALLKARPVAGDAGLGAAFVSAAGTRVWTRPFGAEELRQLRAMKARAEEQLARQGLQDREVKRGRGGIRDIEFAVQLLQLVHGRRDPGLRSPTTLVALAELAAAGYIAADDAVALEAAYRFLRAVEHRLQLVDEQQVHTVPTAVGARTALARVTGFRDDPTGTALARFDAELVRHQATVRSIHERLFFRPLLEAFTGVSTMTPEAVVARLAAFGFRDAEQTRRALAELTSGLTRSSRLMQQMMALLLGWLSDSPDPDLGLLGLRTLSTGPHRAAQVVATFRESPEAARRLCLLVGTSRLLLHGLERHPELIAELADDAAMAPRTRAQLCEQTIGATAWRGDATDRRQGLQRLAETEITRIAAGDVLDLGNSGGDDGPAGSLTSLAEAVLEAALRTVGGGVPLAVIAMGRFGGAELSYASDLDVIIVHAGTTSEAFEAAEDAAEALLRLVKGATPSERIFNLDADLRPEGRRGPLARSLDSFVAYHRRWGRTWERQALLRARPAAGDEAVGRRFLELVDEVVWKAPFGDEQTREIRRMKARIERERIPAGEDPQFHLKLGRGSLSDVEWTTQLLQLRHGVPGTGTMAALHHLVEAGALGAGDGAALAAAYRFCEGVRNRWYLVQGGPGDALPPASEQLDRLARSRDTTATELREEYRRVTRRARQVVERLFYGLERA